MRLLATIPHYFRRGGGPGRYGSESGRAEERAGQVGRCLAALHQCFGLRQALAGPVAMPTNTTVGASVDVALVTTGQDHLVDSLPRHLFAHCTTDVEPRHLGFVCHDVLRRHAGRYDWFAFLEDDIEVSDPLFLFKLGWFGHSFGADALLQPNRFELAAELEVMKLYIDGPTTRPDIPAQFQDVSVRPKLLGEAFGRSFLFERVENAHSGCFFLSAAQLERAAAAPGFGQPTAAFFGPLESAATLPVMRAFHVYKPARENAGFLEVQHLGRRFLVAAGGPA